MKPGSRDLEGHTIGVFFGWIPGCKVAGGLKETKEHEQANSMQIPLFPTSP